LITDIQESGGEYSFGDLIEFILLSIFDQTCDSDKIEKSFRTDASKGSVNDLVEVWLVQIQKFSIFLIINFNLVLA
jgi:hypothetical protein